MAAPINDFVKAYAHSGTARFHMPGHKGRKFHGLEALDITEIRGADYLFDAKGIIGDSERQTAAAFGSARTLYSTEGSSLCIKTMMGIVHRCRRSEGRRMTVAAPRNVHKAFINACILLDIDVVWVYPEKSCRSLCSGGVSAEDIEKAVCGRDIDCVYITSPDYLGFISDIRAISALCRSMDIPLVCDNAHGAYLAFLEEDLHPLALGADMCCDSAHKTLPCYTGGAYLHISKDAPAAFSECSKEMMSLFASTSPSYLILQSLDLCSDYLTRSFRQDLRCAAARTALCKKRLSEMGFSIVGEEPCKITVCAADTGLTGDKLGDLLREKGVEPEYTDEGYTVLMTSPFNTEEDFAALERAMSSVPIDSAAAFAPDLIPRAERCLPIRQAALSPSEPVPTDLAAGRICAMTVTCCQPSVPIAVSGERINDDIVKLLKKYGIISINAVK